MDLDAIWIWRGAAVALAVALLWGAAFGMARREELAGAAAAVGLLAGWLMTLPLLTATPRQLPERLPLLALVAVLGALAVVAVPALRRLRLPLGAALALGAGWWVAGAPLVLADLERAAPLLLAVTIAVLAATWRMATAGQAAGAGLALLAALAVAGLPGPWPYLAAALAAAAAGAGLARAELGAAARLPVAIALVALAAAPVIARGRAQDWAAAAAPALALLLGPLVAPVFGRTLGAVMGGVLAALPAIGVAAWRAGRFS